MISSINLGSLPVSEDILLDSSEGTIFDKSVILPSAFDMILCVITTTSFSLKDSFFSLIDFMIRPAISSPMPMSSWIRIGMICVLENSPILNNQTKDK
jgi:hypothetical protein